MHFIKKLLNLGLQYANTSQQKRTVKIVNIISLLMLCVCILYIVLLTTSILSIETSKAFFILGFVVLQALTSLFANYYGKLLFAKLFFFLVINSIIFYRVNSSDVAAFNALSFVMGIPIAGLFFTNKEKIWKTIFFILPFILYIISESSDYSIFETINVNSEELKIGRIVYILFNMVILWAIIHSFTADMEKNETQLHHTIEELKITRASLEVQEELVESQKEIKTKNEELQATEEELRQNLEELNATQEQLQEVFLINQYQLEAINTNFGYVEFKLDRTITNVNSRFAAWTEFKPTELIGLSHKQLLHQDENTEYYFENLWKDLETGKTVSGIFKRKTKSNKNLWVFGAYCPVKNQKGEIIRIIKIVSNYNTQKETELEIQSQKEELLATEEELRQNLEELNATQEHLLDAKQEQDKFVDLVEQADAAIAIATLDGKVVYLNKKGQDISGFGKQEYQKTITTDYYPEYEKPKSKQEVLPAIETQGYWRGERDLINHKTGQIYHTDANAFLLKDKSTEEVIGLATVQIDITSQKNLQKELKNKQNVLDEAEKIAKLGSFEIDLATQNVIHSKNLLALYQLDKLESMAELIPLMHSQDQNLIIETLTSAAQGQLDEFDVAYRLKTKNFTEYRYYRAIGKVLKKDDIPSTVIGSVQDIHEQKLREIEISEAYKKVQVSEEELRQNLEELQTTQELLEEQKNEIETAYQELQSTQKQLIQSEKMASLGQLVANIAHEINTPLGAIRSSTENISDNLENNLLQLALISKDCTQEELESFMFFLRKSISKPDTLTTREKRKIRRVLLEKLEQNEIADAETYSEILVDMNMQTEEELFSLLVNNKNGERLINIAYQLSNIIKSNQTIQMATDRVSKIVLALKTFARQDQTEEKSAVNINESLNTTLTLYHNKIKHGIDVSRDFTEIPIFMGYPDELIQVWTNILHNAIQAMNGKGRLEIKTKVKDQKAIISIQDTGGGIPKEIKDKVFDPFFTTKQAGEGSGLGLDITKKIIEKHDGEIWFEIEEGVGTIFFIGIPIN
ncbi:ATP-binding protein [Bernardetia sp. OM2101]|uniref:ATP-binding protein n=1 Tax=Bernardetia sp. OM2101 TaxID=3344876 RepID=UPI0035D11B46